MRALRLGTRGSALAVAQSQRVADAVHAATGREVELVTVLTAGDQSSAPVHRLGVGVFVSALRDALVAQEIDFAVHSYKDLPTAGHPGLHIAAVPHREDPRDALVARDGRTLAELPREPRSAPGRSAGSPNCTRSGCNCRSPRSEVTSIVGSAGCSARTPTSTRWCWPVPA